MSNKLVTTSTLVAALLLAIGGPYNALTKNFAYSAILRQPSVFVAETSGPRTLIKKDIQHRRSSPGSGAKRVYQLNDSKKSHRPGRRNNSYRTDGVSRPKPSRKLGIGGRFVYSGSPTLISPQQLPKSRQLLYASERTRASQTITHIF